ncbi:hypothetical protein AK812_SmicGene45484, partial [Symbiodinium microadriaticum]
MGGPPVSRWENDCDWCRRYLLPDPDGPPSALHRALSGGIAGVLAQTFVYPFDVLFGA